MKNLTKLSLLTSLILTSTSAFASLNDSTALLNEQTSFPSPKSLYFKQSDHLGWMHFADTQLFFTNDGEFETEIQISYGRMDDATKKYSSKIEKFKLIRGENKTVTLKSSDVFVNITAISLEVSSGLIYQKNRFFNLNLCSYNNKSYNLNGNPSYYKKNFLFLGSMGNEQTMFPDNDKEFKEKHIYDADCWTTGSADTIYIYEHAYKKGELKSIKEDTPSLGTFSNRLSSIVIPTGWTIELYEGENYTGNKYTRNNSSDYDERFNDKINSIKIIDK